MKIFLIFIYFGLLLSSCSNAQENSTPKTDKSEKSKVELNQIPEFEIDFPKAEIEVQKMVSNPKNMSTVTNWILEGKDKIGPFMYFVAHNKIPKDLEQLILNDPTQLETALQAMLTSSAEKLGGYDFEFDKTAYKGHFGMASKCKVFNGDGMIKSVVYLIDKDIFMISGGGKNIDEDSLNTFLTSFELKK
jgi:hypothetical protein